MESVYKQADENKRMKFVYAWMFTMMIECVQGNEYVHERVIMYKELNMYIGGIGLTPWGRPMVN